MNAIVFSKANLPSVQNLSQALRTLENSVGSSDRALLKMDKTGHWVFGADQTEVEEGSTWAVNPFSFVHGYIAWGDGEPLAERMVPVSEPLPDISMDPPPPQAKKGWELQVGMGLKCLSGEDEGLEVRYNATSVGGKRAVQKLALDIAAQVEADQSKPVPVVNLKKDHYTHKSYGRIFTPVLEIVHWVGLDGKQDATPPVEAAPVAEAARVRRRRAV